MVTSTFSLFLLLAEASLTFRDSTAYVRNHNEWNHIGDSKVSAATPQMVESVRLLSLDLGDLKLTLFVVRAESEFVHPLVQEGVRWWFRFRCRIPLDTPPHFVYSSSSALFAFLFEPCYGSREVGYQLVAGDWERFCSYLFATSSCRAACTSLRSFACCAQRVVTARSGRAEAETGQRLPASTNPSQDPRSIRCVPASRLNPPTIFQAFGETQGRQHVYVKDLEVIAETCEGRSPPRSARADECSCSYATDAMQCWSSQLPKL